MITLFTTCKPFKGEFDLIQRNAITSWTRLGKGIEIILFGNDYGTMEVCQKLNLIYVENIKRNESGTPYINDIFTQAQRLSKYDILCYANADIIFLEGFIETIKFIKKRFEDFLIVGRRWNADINGTIDFSNINWRRNLKEYIKGNGKLSPDTAIDYFIFTKNLFNNLPPLLLARGWWDTYVVADTLFKTPNVFNATNSIFAIHQNHTYSHIRGGHKEVWKGKESRHNRYILKKVPIYEILGTIEKSFFCIKKNNNSFQIFLNVKGQIKTIFSFLRYKIKVINNLVTF